MTHSGRQQQERDPTTPGSHARGLFWCAVILAAFVGILFFLYQAQRQPRSSEYEGKIVDKWAGYSHSELGSVPYFRLLVENAGGQRSTVPIDRETYHRVKVGMWIRKTPKGIELSSITALPPDVRKRLSPSVMAVLQVEWGYAPSSGRRSPKIQWTAVTEGHSGFLTSGGKAFHQS